MKYKKIGEPKGDYETTVYVDDAFEYHYKEKNANTYEKNYCHIMDSLSRGSGNSSRIAMIRYGTAFPDDISNSEVYNLEDHLGSSSVRLDTNGAIVDKEEYYPFGDSSLRTFDKKRYRFTGKEKDSESGLYYFGARYYAAWTCRFISVDPMAKKSNHQSSYCYADNNPLTFKDPDGNQTDKDVKGSSGTETNQTNNENNKQENTKSDSGSKDSQFGENLKYNAPTWKELILFSPPSSTQKELEKREIAPKARTAGIRYDIQEIEDAYGPKVSLDFYSVRIKKWPVKNGEKMKPEQLLEHIRKNLDKFLDDKQAEFRAYSQKEAQKWNSDNPMNTIKTFEILPVDDGSVIVTKYSETGWIFSTVETQKDAKHPVSGNRYFGFVKNKDGSYTFFTKGVSRLTTWLDVVAGQEKSKTEADKLWKSFIKT